MLQKISHRNFYTLYKSNTINIIQMFQRTKCRGGFSGDSQENLPEYSRRAAGSERGGVGCAAQARGAGPPAGRAAAGQGQLRLLTEPLPLHYILIYCTL